MPSCFIVLVASSETPVLEQDDVAAALVVLSAPLSACLWLAPGRACEIALSAWPDSKVISTLREKCDARAIDFFLVPAENRRKRLLVADMESTIVLFEALEEMADFLKIKHKIKSITDRAMNGEIDFREALAQRLKLLAGVPESYVRGVLEGMKKTVSPGARELVSTMKKHGATCVLVTGGFTYFSDWVARELGFDASHANILDIKGGKLSGNLVGPVVGPEAKLNHLLEYCERLGVGPAEAMTVGDGANDLPMLRAAQDAGGLGVGYRPRAAVERAGIVNLILHGDHRAALYAQGYRADEIIPSI